MPTSYFEEENLLSWRITCRNHSFYRRLKLEKDPVSSFLGLSMFHCGFLDTFVSSFILFPSLFYLSAKYSWREVGATAGVWGQIGQMKYRWVLHGKWCIGIGPQVALFGVVLVCIGWSDMFGLITVDYLAILILCSLHSLGFTA